MLRIAGDLARGITSAITPKERFHQFERNRSYTPNDLLERLERATTGNYKGYYDIDCHDKAMVFSPKSPFFDLDSKMWFSYLTPPYTQLTLEDGTPIDVKENDWLVPLLIRKEGKENIHLLLPSNVIGDLKAGDTLKLKYKEQVFTIAITDDDPQYHDYQNGRYRGKFEDHVKCTEIKLYSENRITKPSKLRRLKAHLSEAPDLIRTINENLNNTFSLNLASNKFERVNPLKSYALDENRQIEKYGVEIRHPQIDSEVHDQPQIDKNGFGLYCDVKGISHLIMTVAKDKLIFWCNIRPLNERTKDIPAEILARLRNVTDEFTVLPLNENTISAEETIQNIDKFSFANCIIELKV